MIKKSFSLVLVLLVFFSCKSTVGSIKTKTAKVNTTAIHFLNKENIPGMAISVSKNGKLIWSQGFGYANLETQTKVSPKTTLFRIASISKPITAFALGLLADDGKIDLDESLYHYLPNYPRKQYDFTLRQLGGHTAGIRHYRDNEFMLNEALSITEGLAIFKNDSLLFKPLSDYKYSTYGFNLLSEVIQTVAKKPFINYVESNIFKPLEMEFTGLDVADSNMPNRTQFYVKNGTDKVILGPAVNNEYKVAGGGFLSTSEDLIRFGNEIIVPTLISSATLKELLTSQVLDSGKPTHYGTGFGIGKTKKNTPKYNHSGGGVGASTLLLIYPTERMVISILTNLSGVPIFDIGERLEAIFVN
ncbi:serine hydrolase domain-containing protein [Aestuariivivens insulae]|uniref:serine hydrolase domain-containing protein n=1 Tax=Aestuariivivens insulae TaxID=1621988 RepID=UPI001F5757F9|nr:serine hydrolase domain-containing protein [Aestuariivivens insulae]